MTTDDQDEVAAKVTLQFGHSVAAVDDMYDDDEVAQAVVASIRPQRRRRG